METTVTQKRRTREDVLAWLQNAREIKARRQREAEELFAERQRKKKEAIESGYYNFDWWKQYMNRLDINRIRDVAPYAVFESPGGAILFETEYGVQYSVTFDDDTNPYYTAYWFNLSNMNNVKSPGDIKIPQTVICIIEEFFRVNPNILLYLCSNAKGQQAQRARLFMRWFNGYEQQQKYVIRAVEINTVDDSDKPTKDYVALLVQRTHPQLEKVVSRFEEEIAMFNEYKP